jgi:hypothetical protein
VGGVIVGSKVKLAAEIKSITSVTEGFPTQLLMGAKTLTGFHIKLLLSSSILKKNFEPVVKFW